MVVVVQVMLVLAVVVDQHLLHAMLLASEIMEPLAAAVVEAVAVAKGTRSFD